MSSHNPNNERIKRRYFAYLKEAKRLSEATVDAVAKALSRFEEFTCYRDFRTFHIEQAMAFKRRLSATPVAAGTKPLSKATLHATLADLRKFFFWLAGQPGYRSRISYSDADYFNLSEKDSRIAKTRRETAFPTIEQVKHVLGTMPNTSDIEQRNRALIAFVLSTGVRDGALASLKLKHVDPVEGSVYQDAREVRTKFSKSFTTYLFPVGDDIHQIVRDWLTHLRTVLLWGNDDPLFPATAVTSGENRKFEVTGLKRDHWSNAEPIRRIFREAFAHAGLPYYNPHSLRSTLVQLGERLCQTPEHFKAWSQNLGHEGVLTTLNSYGAVSSRRQAEVIRELAVPPARVVDEVTRQVLKQLGIGNHLAARNL